MEERKSISKNSVVATISALAAAAVVTGGGIAWWTMHDRQPVATNTPNKVTSSTPATVDPATVNPSQATPMPVATAPTDSSVPSPIVSNPIPTVTEQPANPTPSIAQNQQSTVKIWRIDDDGKKTILVPQNRKIARANAPAPAGTSNADTQVRNSMNALLASAGKLDGKLTSTIPVGTKLLGATVKADGIHIDLSKEFIQSSGATSTIGRLGQVVYTATEQNPDAQVWITVEGKKLEVLGDAGVEVRQPITRQSYSQDFPIDPSTSNNP